MQKMSWPAKPIKFTRRLAREQLKGFYKQQRYEDRHVGKKIDSLFTRFHAEFCKPPAERSGDALKLIVTELAELRSQKTFRKEFPTFASFKKYVKEENLTIKDLLANS